ncbi:22827_t:CDS:2, partial [Racocetra persica]
EQVEGFFAKYDIQNKFRINKYWIKHSKSEEVQKRTFICEFGKHKSQIEITTLVNKHNNKLLAETLNSKS